MFENICWPNFFFLPCGEFIFNILNTGALGLGNAAFGQGTGPIYLDNVMCTGTELNIRNCTLLTTHNCVHFEDASVICTGESSLSLSITQCLPTLPQTIVA